MGLRVSSLEVKGS